MSLEVTTFTKRDSNTNGSHGNWAEVLANLYSGVYYYLFLKVLTHSERGKREGRVGQRTQLLESYYLERDVGLLDLSSFADVHARKKKRGYWGRLYCIIVAGMSLKKEWAVDVILVLGCWKCFTLKNVVPIPLLLVDSSDIYEEFHEKLGFSKVQQLLLKGPSGRYYLIEGDSGIRTIQTTLSVRSGVLELFVVDEGDDVVPAIDISHNNEPYLVTIDAATEGETSEEENDENEPYLVTLDAATEGE
ncbi:hypothetical protein KY290_021785 [Solanum tuberosum]|uniref:Integrase core domain containing protein n=1 Tax=Solanum tuberosum TaxID=4113 RepID=A0ABQ7V2H8_SOLTU|nr:hypothetical protein KY289_022486 [Solanum tuberosum]KAH0758292.1 hypothetical protein KY290_021785 [Solanum tuberosum]